MIIILENLIITYYLNLSCVLMFFCETESDESTCSSSLMADYIDHGFSFLRE